MNAVRTLFITKNVPHPPIGGVALRNWQNMNIMMKYGPVAVFSASTWTPNYQTAPSIAMWKHCNVTERTFWEKPERRFWWLRRRGHPDADWAYARQAAQELDRLIAEFKPHLVVFEEVWLYRYLPTVKRHNCLIIFDEHNVEADIFKQKFHAVKGLRAKLKVKRQLPQLKMIERELIQDAKQVWVCSQEDVNLLKQQYGADSYVVPNGVNVDYYQEGVRTCQLPKEIENPYRSLLYLGQLSYEPNTVAVRVLLDQIYPQLKQAFPDCRLLLVGRNPTSFMLEAAQKDPSIRITGSVPDVRPYLVYSSLMLVPLLQGGGTRLKILEAFATGCPVISTTKGAEGLMVKDGEHLLVRDSVEAMLEGVSQLWSDPALGDRLARAALELVRANYSWEAVGKRVDRAIAAIGL